VPLEEETDCRAQGQGGHDAEARRDESPLLPDLFPQNDEAAADEQRPGRGNFARDGPLVDEILGRK